MTCRAVSIVTVAGDRLFFARLLVVQVGRMIARCDYEIVIVDQGSGDGIQAWARRQPDVSRRCCPSAEIAVSLRCVVV